MTREELIAALERLEAPSREIDLEIARLQNVVVLRHNVETSNNDEFTYHRYTSSVDSALTLINGLYCIFHMEFPSVKYLPANADGTFTGAPEIEVPIHVNVPIALCIAALKGLK